MLWSQKPLRQCFLIALFGMIMPSSFFAASLTADNLGSVPSDSKTQELLMRGAKPKKNDAYLCTAFPVTDQEDYIYKFEVVADASTAHHILVYGCAGEAASNEQIWNCGAICREKQSIIFAWAKNAPPTILPKGVGVRIGQQTSVKTIVLQVHYAKSFAANEPPDHSGVRIYTTQEKQPFVAGIFLLGSDRFQVPPGNPSYPVDISCIFYKEKSIFPFAFRTHAHGLSTVITGYHNNGSYHEIGKGNPQWPQAFYPAKNNIEVKLGDYLTARCTYNSTSKNDFVGAGPTGSDEMCNFYIMFYTDSSVKDPYGECWNNAYPELTGQHFPPDVSVTLPPDPALEEEAKGHHHHHGGMITSTVPEGGASRIPNLTKNNTDSQILHIKMKNNNTVDGKMSVQGNREYSGKIKFGVKPDIQEKSREVMQYDYDFDELDPRGRFYEKRQQGEYYEDYAANDLRSKGLLEPSPGGTAAEGRSRNRNREFEAMNQQLQDFPRKNSPFRQAAQQISNAADSGDGNSEPRRPLLMEQRPPVGPGEKVHSQIHFDQSLMYNASWPVDKQILGQIGGVATDKDGNVYIFHRGSRKWSGQSFSLDDDFMDQDTPIPEDVIVVLDSQGHFIRKFGAGQYFMPHGIEVDSNGNIWLTDVALHQVFKIPPGETTPSLVLGRRFKHGSDLSSFCKPTDVAVLSSGEFFVSDGYCNGRVLKFAKNGTLIKAWGDRSPFSENPPVETFNIPHSITVSEENKLVCVADRENGRVQCFDLDGNFKHVIKKPQFGPRLFAIEQCPVQGGILYAVNGPGGSSDITVQGFTLDINTGHILEMWNVPQQLKNPHDVCVHPKSRSVYVGELDPEAVWKLSRTPSVSNLDKTTQKHGDASVETKVNGNTTVPTGKPVDRVSVAAGNNSTLVVMSQAKNVTSSDLTPSLIIGCLLVVPVILLLIITLIVRARKSGSLKCWGQSKKRVFSLQGILGNSHKGFDPLSTEDSDHDLDQEDSDREEYLAPRKIKSKA